MKLSVLAVPFLLVLPLAANAQETGSGAMTSTGTVIEQPVLESGALLRRLDVLAADAEARGITTRTDLLALEAKFTQMKDERTRQAQRRLEHRTDCRERLRKANRDQQAETAATCFKEELALETAILRKERTIVASLASLSPEVRVYALTTTDALIDAAQTIMDAVDAGLYTETAEMEDAKARLHARYRVPRMGAMLLAETDMDRAWNALFALRLQQRLAADPRPLEQLASMDLTLSCLERQQAFWTPAQPLKTYSEIKDIISQFRSEQPRCIHFVWSVNRWPMGAGTEAAPDPA